MHQEEIIAASTLREEELPELEDHLKPLNGGELRFVFEYLKDFYAQRAALRAGYEEKARAGYALLSRERVRHAIEVEKARLVEQMRVEVVELLRELKILAFSDIEHYSAELDGDSGRLVVPEGYEGVTRAVASKTIKRISRPKPGGEEVETTVTIKLWSKLEALKMLAEHVGLLKQAEKEESGHGGVAFVAEYIAQLRAVVDAFNHQTDAGTGTGVGPDNTDALDAIPRTPDAGDGVTSG